MLWACWTSQIIQHEAASRISTGATDAGQCCHS